MQVSNHVASVDDPFVIASLLPPSILLDAHSLRWTLCATDRCFSNPATSAFFQCVKVLPVSRGDGIYQKVIFFMDPSLGAMGCRVTFISLIVMASFLPFFLFRVLWKALSIY